MSNAFSLLLIVILIVAFNLGAVLSSRRGASLRDRIAFRAGLTALTLLPFALISAIALAMQFLVARPWSPAGIGFVLSAGGLCLCTLMAAAAWLWPRSLAASPHGP